MSSMTRWTSKRSIGIGLILAAMLLVTIYGFADNLLSAQATSSKTPRSFGVLNHAPTGTAALLWSQTSHTLIVTVVASGLAPNSTHPDAIHNGSNGGCTGSTQGNVVYGLNPVNADSTGKGTSVTTIPNVQQGIPGQGWYIDMHNGPQLTDSGQQERIACANIINPNALIPVPPPTTSSNPPTTNPSTTVNTIDNESPGQTRNGSVSSETPPQSPGGPPSVANDQVVNVTLGGSADEDQSVSVGAVELSLSRSNGNSQLTVKIYLYRLKPKSTHVAHIHNGSCENQGSVLYPLSPVRADSVGFGTSTTVVKSVSSIPNTGWYVNVHRASSKDGLNNQTGFDPIACVDISTSNNPIPSSNPTSSGPPPTPTPFIE